MTLEWLRVLRAQAGSLKVRFSELDQLCQAISAVEAFQVRLATRMLAPVHFDSKLQVTLKVSQLQAPGPELCWLQARTKEVLQVKPGLEALRDLVAECDSLAISILEMQIVNS